MPLHEAVKYVAAAYVAVFVIILLYVAIMASRLRRTERELGELLRRTSSREQATQASTSSLGGTGADAG